MVPQIPPQLKVVIHLGCSLLFCHVREFGNRLVRLKSHLSFLSCCITWNLVATGFELKNAINLGDDNLYQEIKHMLHGTSQSIQTKVRDC